MSLETYQRLLRDPKSSWAKLGVIGSTPVPVPLHANETVGDYQQKFEFWLAQRNITLESLQDDVMRERSFRCGYAQWRAQMADKNTSITSYGPQLSGARSTRGRERETPIHRVDSPERNVTRRGESRAFSSTDSTRRTGGCYGTHHLDRRLKQLESIVARIGVSRGEFFDSTSVSHYERDISAKLVQKASAQICIDLTGNIGVEGCGVSLQSESKVDNEPFSVSAQNHPRSVEITPTYSDTNHEGEWETGDAEKPTDQAKTDVESADLAILINGYNEFNDQVLMKQREERKLVADMGAKDMSNSYMATQRSQIYELRDIIDTEKNMRDAAVAAIILFNCVEKENEIGQDLLKVVATDDAAKQDALHEKCAGIATKLQEKDTELTRLYKQLQSLSSLIGHGERGDQEAQALSSKIDVERAAKCSLETERHKIFSRLMKASPQIQAIVSEELADKFSTRVEKDMSCDSDLK
ncbi:hypothetical protein DVH05_023039 [Phytophthora capsici]|nr:hypothetical protein DVH05_023039 [Phytophthora capsici]